MNEIREHFCAFLSRRGTAACTRLRWCLPTTPTLLFTNAGMNQFKDVFTGAEKREYSRATTSQKCVRAGGKHNDLENVGFTRRHHTFFEMLGNFSFGDYFKRDAIAYAWELVTSPSGSASPKTSSTSPSLKATADVPRDDEAEQFWIETGVPKERIFQFGLKDNFWQMGETGPCGPVLGDLLRHGPRSRRDSAKSISPLARTTPATSRSGTWSSCSSTAPPLPDEGGKTTGYR
jgi:alanyl-tRNA synthetase